MKTFAFTFCILAGMAIIATLGIIINQRLIKRNNVNIHGVKYCPDPVKDYWIFFLMLLFLSFALSAGIAKFILTFNFLENFSK